MSELIVFNGDLNELGNELMDAIHPLVSDQGTPQDLIPRIRDELRRMQNLMDRLKNEAVPVPASTPPPCKTNQCLAKAEVSEFRKQIKPRWGSFPRFCHIQTGQYKTVEEACKWAFLVISSGRLARGASYPSPPFRLTTRNGSAIRRGGAT